MSTYRQSVHDYIRACEALLTSPDLSDHEIQAVEKMMTLLSAELLSSGGRYQTVTIQEEAFVLTKAQATPSVLPSVSWLYHDAMILTHGLQQAKAFEGLWTDRSRS